jgi:hypothetical protein
MEDFDLNARGLIHMVVNTAMQLIHGKLPGWQWILLILGAFMRFLEDLALKVVI